MLRVAGLAGIAIAIAGVWLFVTLDTGEGLYIALIGIAASLASFKALRSGLKPDMGDRSIADMYLIGALIWSGASLVSGMLVVLALATDLREEVDGLYVTLGFIGSCIAVYLALRGWTLWKRARKK